MIPGPAPSRPLRRPRSRPGAVRRFLQTEAAGGAALLVATILALALANSPLGGTVARFWTTEVGGEWGLGIELDLRHWVNEALMALFFFVVGLEIKRELVAGELAELRKAAMPIVAAVGGMAVPAMFYLALNPSPPESAGWGIAVATDIAFVAGALALFGDRVPSGLRVFMLSLAIVDDIGAIVLIALFYPGDIHGPWLLSACALAVGIAGLRVGGVRWAPAYVVAGIGMWLATLESGVHPTIAGVALGLLAPAIPKVDGEPSTAERVQTLLHPWTSLVVIPLFALANAGVSLSVDGITGALTSSVGVGIFAGLVAGKLIGISAASWGAARLGIATRPGGVGWRHVMGGAALGGIGFTVSLFIAAIAFTDEARSADATIAVLAASLVAAALGAGILLLPQRRRRQNSGA